MAEQPVQLAITHDSSTKTLDSGTKPTETRLEVAMAARYEGLDKYAAAEAEVREEIRHIAAWRLENARRTLIVKLNPDLKPKSKPKKGFEIPTSPVDEGVFKGMWVWVEVLLLSMLVGFVVKGVGAERVEVRRQGQGRTEIRCRGDVGVCADGIGVHGPRVVGMEEGGDGDDEEEDDPTQSILASRDWNLEKRGAKSDFGAGEFGRALGVHALVVWAD